MSVVFGPILRKTGGYGYESFAPELGHDDGATYRRIEDAIYAQRAEASQGGVLCRTVEEFRSYLTRWSEVVAA